MNEFKKRIIKSELREASEDEIKEIFDYVYNNENFRKVINSFISDEVKMREYTEAMIKAQTIKYSVIG
jgi:hypothetical protein